MSDKSSCVTKGVVGGTGVAKGLLEKVGSIEDKKMAALVVLGASAIGGYAGVKIYGECIEGKEAKTAAVETKELGDLPAPASAPSTPASEKYRPNGAKGLSWPL